MKTSLIEGKRVSCFDRHLLKELPSKIPSLGTPHPITIGVENEYGEIYRIIETGDIVANIQLIKQLRMSGYFIEPLMPDDESSLWAVVKYQFDMP